MIRGGVLDCWIVGGWGCLNAVDGALCADPRFVIDGLNGLGACDDVCGGWRALR